MAETGVGILALKLIATGFALGLGFWLSKKVTNRVDEYLLTHSKEFKALVEAQRCPTEQTQLPL